MSERGWFADVDMVKRGAYRWQPVLDTGTGFCPAMPVWFDSKEACEKFIEEEIVGVGMFPEGRS